MATRYIETVADATGEAQLAPNVPGKAAISFRLDIAQLMVRNPSTGSALRIPTAASSVQTLRTRLTIAQVNAGATLLAAIPGRKYRLVSARIIAVGGAVAAVTTVDILGTQSTAVKLVAFAQASATQSTELKSGGTGATILADGASYVANDANTAITIGITGSNITTAVSIDVFLDYTVEE